MIQNFEFQILDWGAGTGGFFNAETQRRGEGGKRMKSEG